MQHTAVVAAVLGVFIAILGWALGDWSAARRLRTVVGGLNSSARRGLAERGLNTGGFGRWLSRHRVLVRAVVVALAVVWLLLLRPLSFGDIVLVIVVALLVTWMLELLQRRPEETTTQRPPKRPPPRSTSPCLPRRQHRRLPPPSPAGTPHPSEKTSRRTLIWPG